MQLYGTLPDDLGLVDLNPVEMKFWMYCPIKLPGNFSTTVPPSLYEFEPILAKVFEDLMSTEANIGLDRWIRSYVYLTAKTLYVTGDNPGNRPGWHSDGFRTDDLNYIWYDRAPTEFTNGAVAFTINDSIPDGPMLLRMMGDFANRHATKTYPNKHVLKLDERVIHRVAPSIEPGMRTFVKVSISTDKYDLEGNSINPIFGPIFEMKKRNADRNHPASVHQ